MKLEAMQEAEKSVEKNAISGPLKTIVKKLQELDQEPPPAELVLELEKQIEGKSQLAEAFHRVNTRFPILAEAPSNNIAKEIMTILENPEESEESKRDFQPCVDSVGFNLLFDEMQNIKSELRKTYYENNISFIANEVEVGLDENKILIPATKRPLPQDTPHIFSVPTKQKQVIDMKDINEFNIQHSPHNTDGRDNVLGLSEFNTPMKKEEFPLINLEEDKGQGMRFLDYEEEEYSSEEMGEGLEAAKESTSSRSSRGLRVLSVRVRELVFEKKVATYKEVADDLIKELQEEGKMPRYSHHTKDEKNVRRRVYDALNVLIAAGIIQKNGKEVQYDPRMKFQTEKSSKNQTEANKQLSEIREEIAQMRAECEHKRQQIQELKKKKRSVKNLIHRNQQIQEKYGKGCASEEIIRFPFIVLSTENAPDNAIALRISEDQRQIQLGFKKPFALIGDIDALLQLQMHRMYPRNPI